MSATRGINIHDEGGTLVFSGQHLGVWWSGSYPAGEQNPGNIFPFFAALQHDGEALENIIDGYTPTGVVLGPPPTVDPPVVFPPDMFPRPTVTYIYGNGPMCSPWGTGCRPAWDGWKPDNPAPPDYYGTATPEPGTAGLLVLSMVLALALKLAQKARDAVR